MDVDKSAKRCPQCKNLKPTTLEFFHSHKRKSDGLTSWCKDCLNQKKTEWRRTHPVENKVKRQKEYTSSKQDIGKFREKNRRWAKVWQQRNPEAVAAVKVHWRKNHWEHTLQTGRARLAVARALKKGQITCAGSCHRCGNVTRTFAHHYKGYEKEFYLAIEWLCGRCHAQHHFSEKV